MGGGREEEEEKVEGRRREGERMEEYGFVEEEGIEEGE